MSGYIGEGRKVEAFENEFWRFTGLPHPPAMVNSGTSAIVLAMDLIGIGPGDEVVTSPMTCLATNAELWRRRCRVVWADVDQWTGLVTPKTVAKAVSEKTRAVIVVNWGGVPCDIEGIRDVIGDATLPIIEDAAHGPYMMNKGTYVAWSFQAIKHLTTGDGGALHVPFEQFERVRRLRWFGLDRKDKRGFRCEQDVAEVGGKFQMNDIAAAIGLANLADLKANLACSKDNARHYTHTIMQTKYVASPCWHPMSSWWLYTMLVDDRVRFVEFMKGRGVEANQVHSRNDMLTAFKESRTDLPGLDFFAGHNVAIPVGPWLTSSQRDHVADAVNAYSVGRADGTA